MKIYSVYDVVREDYAPPFVAKNDGEASRMFLQGVKKISNFSDLRLYKLSDWCPEDLDFPIGDVKPVEIPVQIGETDE